MDTPRKGLIAEVMGAWVIVCALSLVHLKITDVGVAVEAKTHDTLGDGRGVAVSRSGAGRRVTLWCLECLAATHAADADVKGARISVMTRHRVTHAGLALGRAAADQTRVLWDRAFCVCDTWLTAVRDEVVDAALGRSAIGDGARVAVITLYWLKGALTR